jgi:endonuclease-3
MSDQASKTLEILRLLEQQYGKKKRPVPMPILDLVVLATLQEHGPRSKARQAQLALLETFTDWNEVRVSSQQEISEALEPIYKTRGTAIADALRLVLGELFTVRNQLSLEYLAGIPVERCQEELEKMSMLSAEVRELVIGHTLCNPDQPMPSAVVRVAKRIGLIGAGVSYEKAREVVAESLTQADIARFNLLLFEHGEKVCTNKTYDCTTCCLVKRCERGREKTPAKMRTSPSKVRKKPAPNGSSTPRRASKSKPKEASGRVRKSAVSRTRA